MPNSIANPKTANMKFLFIVVSLSVNFVSAQIDEIGCFVSGECVLSPYISGNETTDAVECLNYCKVIDWYLLNLITLLEILCSHLRCIPWKNQPKMK